MCLEEVVEEGQEDRVVIRHDKQVDSLQCGAGLQVTKRMPDVTVLTAVRDVDLRGGREG